MQKTNNYRLLVGIIVFGSLWGMIECTLGGVKLGGAMSELPVGALLGGLVGLGLMAWSRRIYGIQGMQLGIAAIAGLVRFIAPFGSCVICSALAIIAEGAMFEFIFNRPIFSLTGLKDARTLVFLGIISGFVIYVTGYVFTQIATPIAVGAGFYLSDLAAVMPLIIGRGFFAAVFGGIALPVAVLSKHLNINVAKVKKEYYYPISTLASVSCWVLVLGISMT